MKGSLLIIDDEKSLRSVLKVLLETEGFRIEEAKSGLEGLEKVQKTEYDAIILDLRLPDIDGIDVLERVMEKSPSTKVILLTAYGSIKNAVEAIKRGAYDYLTKPFEPEEVITSLDRAIKQRRLEVELETLKEQLASYVGPGEITGKSPAMMRVFQLIGIASKSDVPVLITGETGTGKELVARAIHKNGKRRDKPFIAINCAAIPESLLEAEIFGYSKGAFTGATQDKKGKFEAADEGTLLLDEIGEMAVNLQPKLLRALESGAFSRLGEEKERTSNVRIIASTNSDLKEKIGKGEFREDLYYRISVLNLHSPPLRNRKEDIPLLSEEFNAKIKKRGERAFTRISPQAVHKLMLHDWPGNVRELRNVIERAVLLGEGETLLPEFILFDWKQGYGDEVAKGFLTLEEVEVEHIKRTLVETGFNQTQAAKILGIDRTTLIAKIKKHGIREDSPG